MKKVYIVPTVATYEICTEGIMSLSARDKGDGQALNNSDIESGAYEICTNKKEGYWDTEW